MKSTLEAEAIPTGIFKAGQKLAPFVIAALENHLPNPRAGLEGKVLAITSKIVSLAENRLVSRASIDKESLVKSESDRFLGEIGYGCYLTIKHGLFIPSAGIDESNSASDDYILFPVDPHRSALELRQALADHWGLKKFGILMTDSHTSPLRVGVTGITLAHSGFRGVKSRIGSPDLFGRPLKMTRISVADACAVAAVFCMGEAAESCPLALVASGQIEFLQPGETDQPEECRIDPETDLYAPLYRKLPPQPEDNRS